MKRCSTSSNGVVVVRKKVKSSSSSSTMSSLPDDILHEILIRLPSILSAIRRGIICKRWHSIVSRPYFMASFVDHIHRSKPPLRLMLGSDFIFGNQPIRSINRLLSLPISGLADSFPWLNSLFQSSDTAVKAICGDLLLLQKSDYYYVFSPLIGKLYRLPRAPKFTEEPMYVARCGIVSKPNNNFNELTRYIVLLIYHDTRGSGRVKVFLFLSETQRWHALRDCPKFKSLEYDDVVASNESLFWVGVGSRWLFALTFFGLEERSSLIRLPNAFYNVEDELDLFNKVQLKLGLFEGQPRLSQLLRLDSYHLSLKVWDLKYDNNHNNSNHSDDDDYWHLVHEVVIEVADVPGMYVFVVAFHPSLSDQIFMLHNHHLYQYDIKTNMRILVAEIHYNSYGIGGMMPGFHVFPFVLPVCPTLL